ncbi:hypothetical protein GCM10027440_35610 [Nocardiopsis coralliicola]
MSAGWTWLHWEASHSLLPCVAVLVERSTGAVERTIRATSPAERDAAVDAADTDRLTGAVRAWLAAQEAA